jgi:cysteinyl-tRNA synthetase
LLGTQYRGPLAFDVLKEEGGRVRFPSIDEAEKRTDYFYATWELLQGLAAREGAGALPNHAHRALFEGTRVKVREALDRDLNTPVVLALLGDHAKAANELGAWIAKPKKAPVSEPEILALAKLALREWEASLAHVGLLQASPAAYAARTRELRLRIRGLDAVAVEAKVQARAEAKGAKDWTTADAIRAELTNLGVELTDAPDGTSRWRVLP